MRRFLFVANGHGENAIAARIASELAAASPEPLTLDLLALVGTGAGAAPLQVVGPHREMPSGGLVAMGNVSAFARDLRAGFASLFAAQLSFLYSRRSPAERYDLVVAVGDAYALALAFLTGAPAAFVGTAKSLYVAPYGPVERALLRRAKRVFVRDAPTAELLRRQRVEAQAPGNVIADLAPPDEAPAFLANGKRHHWIGVLPGSRETAYDDAVRLARVARALTRLRPEVAALVSVAPTLDAQRFARALAGDGWTLQSPRAGAAFEAVSGNAHLTGWSGSLGAFLAACEAVLGQAGTANEQAAAFGVPVFAFGAPDGLRDDWYRMRQRRLLGEGLLLVPPDPERAAAAIAEALADETRLADMRAAGRARMGGRGGAAAIARELLEVV